MQYPNSPQKNRQDILHQLGTITKGLGEFLGWLDWITQNKFAWGCIIVISGLASLLIGRTYSAENCPNLRDFLINTTVPIAVAIALVYVYRAKKITIDYIKKIVSTGLVFLAPIVLTALIYPALTNWDVTKEPVSQQFCRSCLVNVEQANKLLERAKEYLKDGKVQEAEKSLYAAENQYARQAVKDQCPGARYVLAQILDAQADVFKTIGKKQEGIERRKEALKTAQNCLQDNCPPEFAGRLQVQLTLDGKDALELKATEQAIPQGTSTTLKWFAEGADSASLNGQSVKLSGEKEINPTQTTDYTLQVKFNDGTIKTLNTRVIVYSFSINPLIVQAGETSTITWSAEGASRVALDNQLIGVQGSKTVSYTKATSHILHITVPDKKDPVVISKTVLVYSFSATPRYVRTGEPVTLSWNADGAHQVTLDGQIVPLQGSKIVTPTQTTLHNMRIVFPDGNSKSATATINVVPYSFTVTPQFIGPGESSKIEWICPEPLECIWKGEKLSARGSRVEQPTKTTTHTLQVNFPDGSNKLLPATITVGQGECDPQAYTSLGYNQITPILLQRAVTATPSIRIPNIFAQPESSITLTGDEIVCLAATPDGKGVMSVDDQIDFSVTPRAKAWVHNFYDPVTKGIRTFPPQNVTWMFTSGVNRLKLILTDTVQGSFSSTDIWLVVWRR